jgi:hypothetical protein
LIFTIDESWLFLVCYIQSVLYQNVIFIISITKWIHLSSLCHDEVDMICRLICLHDSN